MFRYRSYLLFFVVLTAILPFSQAQQIAPSPRDPFERGLLALQQNQSQEALAAFDLAIKAHPKDARIHNFRGIALMSLGQVDAAANEFRRAIELDATMEDAYRNLGFLEWSAHQTAAGRRVLERALALDPNDAFAGYYLGRLDVDNGDGQAATSLFKRFADRGLAWARFDLALTHLRKGQYQDALNSAQRLTQDAAAAGLLAPAYSIVGIAQSKLDRKSEALAAFQKAADLSPQQEEFWLNLTRQQMDLNRLADAIESAQKGLESNPKSYALHLRLGAAYFAAGKYPEAERSFRDLISAGDPLPTSSIGLAQVLLRTGRASEAAVELSDAERRLGPQFLLLYFEGLALDRAGRRPEAVSAFQRAIQLNGKSAEAHLGLGKTFLALGRNQEAVTELETVLRLEPNSVPARRLLRQAYVRAGNQADAEKLAATPVSDDGDPESNLLGDFILPDWQQPSTR